MSVEGEAQLQIVRNLIRRCRQWPLIAAVLSNEEMRAIANIQSWQQVLEDGTIARGLVSDYTAKEPAHAAD